MAQITLDEALVILNEHHLLVKSQLSNLSLNFKQIAYNSKLVSGKSLFFCKGNFKASYLLDAQNRGAIAYVSEQEFTNVAIPGIIVNDIQKSMSLLSAAFLGSHRITCRQLRLLEPKGKRLRPTSQSQF